MWWCLLWMLSNLVLPRHPCVVVSVSLITFLPPSSPPFSLDLPLPCFFSFYILPYPALPLGALRSPSSLVSGWSTPAERRALLHPRSAAQLSAPLLLSFRLLEPRWLAGLAGCLITWMVARAQAKQHTGPAVARSRSLGPRPVSAYLRSIASTPTSAQLSPAHPQHIPAAAHPAHPHTHIHPSAGVIRRSPPIPSIPCYPIQADIRSVSQSDHQLTAGPPRACLLTFDHSPSLSSSPDLSLLSFSCFSSSSLELLKLSFRRITTRSLCLFYTPLACPSSLLPSLITLLPPSVSCPFPFPLPPPPSPPTSGLCTAPHPRLPPTDPAIRAALHLRLRLRVLQQR